jgi:hypothetical protein
MIKSLETLIIALVATAILCIALLFLPAIIELKKPKDAGPRSFVDSLARFRLSTLKNALINIKNNLQLHIQLLSRLADNLYFIPNLEI